MIGVETEHVDPEHPNRFRGVRDLHGNLRHLADLKRDPGRRDVETETIVASVRPRIGHDAANSAVTDDSTPAVTTWSTVVSV